MFIFGKCTDGLPDGCLEEEGQKGKTIIVDILKTANYSRSVFALPPLAFRWIYAVSADG